MNLVAVLSLAFIFVGVIATFASPVLASYFALMAIYFLLLDWRTKR